MLKYLPRSSVLLEKGSKGSRWRDSPEHQHRCETNNYPSARAQMDFVTVGRFMALAKPIVANESALEKNLLEK
jgi:hypothetical protein